MKIAILSPERSGYAQKRLTEEIESRGHEAVVISPMSLYAFISPKINDDKVLKPKIGSNSKIDISSISAIIPRIAGVRYFDYGCMIVQHFNENLNIFSTATEFGMRICSNKFKNAQFLSRYGIRVPKQVLSHCPNNYKDILDLAGGLPAVGKLQNGSQGAGVFWMNDELAATTSLKSFEKTGTDVIVQNFIDTGAIKNDIRVFVIGPETTEPVIFSYKRYALGNDFRSNYSISHEGEKVEITDEERTMALDASRLMGMPVCGVDIMRDSKDNNKPYIIETNSSPGLSGIESVTGANVAGAIIDYILKNYHVGGDKQNMYNSFITGMNNDYVDNLISHYEFQHKSDELIKKVESLKDISKNLNAKEYLQFTYTINQMNEIIKSGLK